MFKTLSQINLSLFKNLIKRKKSLSFKLGIFRHFDYGLMKDMKDHLQEIRFLLIFFRTNLKLCVLSNILIYQKSSENFYEIFRKQNFFC